MTVRHLVTISCIKLKFIFSLYSDNSAPLSGGKKILLITTKINKNDIKIHFEFYNILLGKEERMEGIFTTKQVHEHCGIAFLTPSFSSITSGSIKVNL